MENIAEDPEEWVVVSPPAAVVEPGQTQMVRFILSNGEPLKMNFSNECSTWMHFMARKPTEVFGSVIAPNGQGVSPPADDLLERAGHALGRQREVNLNAQCLAVEVVDHLEHADFSSSSR